MSYSTQQLRKTFTTHTQTQDWTIYFDWCSQSVTLLFIAKSTNTAQTYPSITLAAAYPKPKAQRGPLQNQVAAFQRYKIHFKKCLPLPHGNHLLSSIITRPHTTRFSDACICHLSFLLSKNNSVHFFCSVYQKITTNYFVIFLGWSWKLEWDLLKNHYIQTSTWFFKGILKGLLLDSLVFVVTLYPGWGCTFVVFFFGLCMENVVIGVGQSYFTATKSWPNSPPQILTPIHFPPYQGMRGLWALPANYHEGLERKKARAHEPDGHHMRPHAPDKWPESWSQGAGGWWQCGGGLWTWRAHLEGDGRDDKEGLHRCQAHRSTWIQGVLEKGAVISCWPACFQRDERLWPRRSRAAFGHKVKLCAAAFLLATSVGWWSKGTAAKLTKAGPQMWCHHHPGPLHPQKQHQLDRHPHQKQPQ